MHRLIVILLLPFIAVGNSFAHCHCMAAHHTPGQDRAHFHVGGGLHHHHHHHAQRVCHGDCQPDCSSEHSQLDSEIPDDHDSDAVYLVAADFVFTASNPSVFEIDVHYVAGKSENGLEACCPCRQGDSLFHWNSAELPIYLFNAALRL